MLSITRWESRSRIGCESPAVSDSSRSRIGPIALAAYAVGLPLFGVWVPSVRSYLDAPWMRDAILGFLGFAGLVSLGLAVHSMRTRPIRVDESGRIVGAFTSKTSDGAQTVVDHFKALFEGQGYEIGSESMTRTGDGAFGVVVGELAAEGRSINVVVIESAGETQVTINYNQKRQ